VNEGMNESPDLDFLCFLSAQFFDDSDEDDDDSNVYDDSDEIIVGANNYDDEYVDFLLADDPSMMDDHEWMFN